MIPARNTAPSNDTDRFEVWAWDGERAEKVGSYPDKGTARRAWSRCSRGACIAVGATVVELRSGTTPNVERKLRGAVLAAHPHTAPIEVPPPVELPPAPRRRSARELLADDEDDDDDEGERPDDEDDEESTDDTDPKAPEPTVTIDPLAPQCVVLGCTEEVPGVRTDTNPALAKMCATHRHRGADAMRRGQADPKSVLRVLNERALREGPGPRRPTAADDPPPAAPAEGPAPAPPPPVSPIEPPPAAPAERPSAPPALVPTVTVPADLVGDEYSTEVRVTVRLPPELVRARRCVEAIGIELVEALAALRSDTPLLEVAAVIARLPGGHHER